MGAKKLMKNIFKSKNLKDEGEGKFKRIDKNFIKILV